MIDLVLQQTQSAATSFTTNSFYIGDSPGALIQFVFTGADVVGSASVQWSLDGVNFSTLPSGVYAVTASSSWVSVGQPTASYMRASWTYTSGTGNITVLAAIRQAQQY